MYSHKETFQNENKSNNNEKPVYTLWTQFCKRNYIYVYVYIYYISKR